MVVPREIDESIRERALDVENRTKSLVFVLRGLPGCGKSTLADEIISLCDHVNIRSRICSADWWFTRGGTYHWDGRELQEAHVYCKGKFLLCMAELDQVIVVDNTNLRTEDFTWYVDMANYNLYDPTVVEFVIDSEEEAFFLVNRSSHITDVAAYNPWNRWVNTFRYYTYGNVIRLVPVGMRPELARTEELQQRGYRT